MSITDSYVVNLDRCDVFVRDVGPKGARPLVFLHGWPEDHSAWNALTDPARTSWRCLSIDLPGIGRSRTEEPNGNSLAIARAVHDLASALELEEPTLVGHDFGGMVVYSCLREYDGVHCGVIMNTVIPGVFPWQKVLTNPYLWHFAFHSIPDLPETLVANHVDAYFDYFYDAISAAPSAITAEARKAYAASYKRPEALAQGFAFYRGLWGDADRNARDLKEISTPVLYLRGEREGGALGDYEKGLHEAGIKNLVATTVPGAGHYAPEEAPAEVWAAIESRLAGLSGSAPAFSGPARA